MSELKENSRLDVRRVAEIARIALSDAEVESLQADLDDIMRFVDGLQEVDVAGVEPTERLADAHSVWREDEPEAGLSHDAAFANAPAVRNGEFVVPKVIE